MARWIINNQDDTTFGVPYIDGLPRTGTLTGPQDNPSGFPQSSLIGSVTNPGAAQKYMFYCARMLRWNDIDLTGIAGLGNRSTCHKVHRFGDLIDYKVQGGVSTKTNVTALDPRDAPNTTSAFARYRFPITVVKNYQQSSRVINFSGSSQPLNNLTCAWIPGAEDSSFHWNPDSTQLSAINSGITSEVVSRGTTLAALKEVTLSPTTTAKQVWNLCVIAWCWAGYQKAGAGGQIYKGTKTIPPEEATTEKRDVNEVDIYYFAFIF